MSGHKRVQRVAIDPCVRIFGTETYSSVDNVDGVPTLGPCRVYVADTEMEADGEITAIAHTKGLVYIAVDWSGLFR